MSTMMDVNDTFSGGRGAGALGGSSKKQTRKKNLSHAHTVAIYGGL